MIKTILVPSLSSILSPQALELSLKAAKLFDSQIECLHVHPDARELARFTTSLDVESSAFSGQIWESMVEGDKTCTKRSRKIFDDFSAGLASNETGAVTLSWREVEGNSLGQTTRRALYNDLVVFGRPALPDDLTTTGVADVLVESGRPMLLAPSQASANPFSNVVIAWKETAASARAVAAAMPFLAKARKIDILGVVEGREDHQPVLDAAERLAESLRRHGLKPQAGHVMAGERNACDVLLEAAADKLHGGLLVMGGYGHSRAREFVFGGFTRRVLHSAPLPILLSH